MNELSLFKSLLDNIQDGICIYDKDGNFVYVNNAVVKLRGIPRQEYLKMNVHDLCEIKYINVCIFDMAMEQKKEVTALQRYYVQGKAVQTRLVTAFPLFDANGNISYIVTILRDIQAYEALRQQALQENQVIERVIDRQVEHMPPVAESPQMKALLSMARNVSLLDSTVVLSGESGTGKEVLARYIHSHSHRRHKPMVEVNCAAFPENLLEAELFGYEKGAFTGALNTGKIGLVEAANGSTLFLDEINSFPLSLQSKLLRVIEDKSIKPLGAVRSYKVDFRLIAATNADLAAMVEAGTFRADLFYRLNVIPLRLPPLREHKEDIVPLCMHFLDYYAKRYALHKRLSKAVLGATTRYDWPGNVRELRNFVERILVMTPPTATVINQIPDGMLGGDAPGGEKQPWMVTRPELDSDTIVKALEACGGHRERTAQYLGISRRTLQYKLRELGLTNRTPHS